MPTAAQRQAQADARAAELAAQASAQQADNTTDGVVMQGDTRPSEDPDVDLLAMTSLELRTETKRLYGADYDHTWDGDRDALIGAARAGRQERRDYYAGRRAERVAAAQAVIRGADGVD